jgi:transposase
MLASRMQAGHGILCVEDAMGLPKYAVTLSDDERTHLRTLLRRGTVSARRLMRARILLTADEDRTDVEVAEVVGVGIATVHRIRQRCVEEGLEAALGEHRRKGAAPKFTPKQHAHVIALACSTPPAGHARWTLRLLADRVVELGLVERCSYETIRRTLKKTPSSRGKRAAGASRRSGPRS